MVTDFSDFVPIDDPEGQRQLRQHFPFSDDDLGSFRSKHRSSPHVGAQPLYALPGALRRALADEVPAWFTADELALENDLEMLCQRHHAIGMFLDRPVLDISLMPPPRFEISEDQRIALGWDATALARMRAVSAIYAERSAPLYDRLDAYRGWLVTNPQFLDELGQVRRRWESVIVQLGAIPYGSAMARAFDGPEKPAT